MRNKFALAALTLVASLGLSGCATLQAPVLPQDTSKLGARFRPFQTVKDSVNYGHLMMALYDDQSIDLAGQDFGSSIPVFALAATSVAMLAFGTDNETVAGVGLGAGTLEVARRQLDFKGRSAVLAEGINNWKCFKDRAARVVFLDSQPSPGKTYDAWLRDQRQALDKAIKDANDLLPKVPANTTEGAQLRDSLKDAITAAESSRLVADRVVRSSGSALETLADERFLIESVVRHKYAGVVKPFESSVGRQLVFDAFKQLAADQSATADIHRSFMRSAIQAKATMNVMDAQAFVAANGPDPKNIDDAITALKQSSMIFTDQDQQALISLQTDLAACR